MSIVGNGDVCCIVAECSKRKYAKGLCKLHYERLRKTGNVLRRKICCPSKGRDFLHSLVGTKASDCIVWPYARNRDGYGQIYFMGSNISSARAMCILAYGDPEPKMEAAHSCGNGHLGCVNPNHLRWATRSQNQRDRRAHGTLRTSNKITEDKVRKIRYLLLSKSGVEIGKQFGVTSATIYAIKSGKTWSWVS